MNTDSSHNRRLSRFAGFVPIDQSDARINNRHADEELAFSLERLNIQRCKSVWEIKEKELEALEHLRRFERQKALARCLTTVDIPRIMVDLRRRERNMSVDPESENEDVQWKAASTVPQRKVYSPRDECSKACPPRKGDERTRSDSRTHSNRPLESLVNNDANDTEAEEDIATMLIRRHSSLTQNKDADETSDCMRMGEMQSVLYKRTSQVSVPDKYDCSENLTSEFQLRNFEHLKAPPMSGKERMSWVKASVKLDTDPGLPDQDEQSAELHTMRSKATKRTSSFRHLRKRPTMGKVRSKKELISLTHFDNILAATESEKKDKRDKEKREIQRTRDDRLSARLQMFYHKVDDLEYKKSYRYCEDNLSSKSFIFYKYS